MDVKQFPARFYELTTGGDTPDPGTDPEPEETYEVAKEVKAGTAYKYAVQQNGISNKPLLYFTGKMNGYYFETSEKVEDAVDVMLEETEGGYFLKFTDSDGKTQYVTITVTTSNGKEYVNVGFAETGGAVFTYNETYKTLYTEVAEKGTYYLGTYGTKDTISASSVEQYLNDTTVDVKQFPARFYEK